jgi:serpin B
MDELKPHRVAAESINTLGIDLLLKLNTPASNTLLSPYSLQCALVLAYAGAEGDTKTEMGQVLHYPPDDVDIRGSFASLNEMLDATCRESNAETERLNRDLQMLRDHMHGKDMKWFEEMNLPEVVEPFVLSVANRVFLQTGFDLRASFMDLLKSEHPAAFESLDFSRDPAGAVEYINAWVEEQTRKRIRNLIPDGSLDRRTRIVLANAIYLKARWSEPFQKTATGDLPFHLQTGETIKVPTMNSALGVGFSRREGFIALTLPYDLGDIHFVILMPDCIDGLTELARKLNPKLLEECSALAGREVILHLPKFWIEPPVMQFSKEFQALGMKTAFDIPRGSANFEGIAPRHEDDYLAISEIFHKTFISLDENGTEAAAATALGFAALGGGFEMQKDEVYIDRPFFFAIQHRRSGACLFLGYLADPR